MMHLESIIIVTREEDILSKQMISLNGVTP